MSLNINKDYYKILGLASDASVDDIKKAYRALAKKHHPDVNPDDAEAEDLFKELNEANEVLSNKTTKAQYDAIRSGNVNYDGILNFGPRGGNQNLKNSDIEVDACFSVENSFLESEISFDYQYKISCTECSGVGGSGSMKVCPSCHGRKIVPQIIQTAIGMTINHTAPCNLCHAIGMVFEHACLKCHGEGTVPTTGTVRAKYAPGMIGTILHIPNAGHKEFPDKPRGTLHLRFNISPHSRFQTNQLPNLIFKIEIDPVQAVLGGELKTKGINDEELTYSLDPNVREGANVVFPEKGIYYNTSMRGSLIGVIYFKIPNDLTDEQKELLNKYIASRETKEE